MNSSREEVAQVSNLLYRGFPIRQPSLCPECLDSLSALPGGSRRYSPDTESGETSATLVAAFPPAEIP